MTLEQFLVDLPWSDNMRHKLRVMADRDDVRFLVAWDNAGKLSASAFTKRPKAWPGSTKAIWAKHPEKPQSRTMRAVELVTDKGLTVYAAAKQVGVEQSAVHRALQRRANRKVCDCCGQVIREFKDPGLWPASS